MNILFITHEFKTNGASRSMIEIIDILSKDKEYNFYALSCYPFGRVYNELKKRNIKVFVLPYCWWLGARRNRLEIMYNFFKWQIYDKILSRISTCLLKLIIKRYKIDVIHTNTGVVDIGCRVKKICDVKHVWHIREFGDKDFDMHPLLSEDLYKKNMNYGADFFIFISKAVYKHYYWIDSEKKRLIYNGVSLKQVGEKKYDDDHRNVNILVSGRISNAKGQKTLIKACIELLNRGVLNFYLIIAGAGKPNDLEGYDILLKYKKVVHLGFVEDMSGLRKKIDIEVVCSKNEAFGRVTVEAMLSGIPVIVSNTGGSLEIISNWKTGVFFEEGNYIDLADKIQKLIDNKQLRNTIGRNGKIDANNKFTIEICSNNIKNLYNNILNRR